VRSECTECVRHYGLFAGSNRAEAIKDVRELAGRTDREQACFWQQMDEIGESCRKVFQYPINAAVRN
jgi:hypothetical protein